jgi:hypothetical protein
MKMNGENEPNVEELKKLEAALRALEKERVFVPGQVDEKVQAEIQNHFGHKKAETKLEWSAEGKIEGADLLFKSKRRVTMRRRGKGWWMQKVLPLAASIAIAAVMIQFARMGRTVVGDINADGNVDVVDALLLAERVRSGDGIGKARRWDVNGDRVVDARDSEEIMARVVDLERSGS